MKPSPKRERQKEFCYTHYLHPSSDIHPVFVRFDYNCGRESFDYGTHRHSDHELVYVESGQYGALLNRRKVSLVRNQMLLICPGDEHRDHARPGLKYYTVSFFIRHAPNPGSEIPLLSPALSAEQKIFTDKGGEIGETIRKASTVMQSPATGSTHLAQALLHEIFWRLVRGISQECYSNDFFRLSAPDNFSSRFYAILQNSADTALPLDKVARQLSVSTSQLAKLCRRHMGQSPGKLIQSFRMDKVAELLAKSDLPIAQISQLLGFPDQFTLSRSFRRQTGLSPLAYRKKMQSDADLEITRRQSQ